MKRKEPNIIPIFGDYLEHVDFSKTIDSPVTVSKKKENHPDSYWVRKDVTAKRPFGNTSLECEIRQGAPYNYSFSYHSDRIPSKVLMRLDTGDGTHNNAKYVPGIPLELSSVPTPHLHKFREDGYAVAYPIPGVDYTDEPSTKFDYQQGFYYLCTELNMTDPQGNAPLFMYAPDGVLNFPAADANPNEGADFDTTC